MKKLFLFVMAVCMAGISSPLLAQDDETFDDLMILYADANYEKCVAKGEKYTTKDKTKSHPLPYLYMAMSFFEMSKDQKYHEDFPKAYKDALSYATKYRRKDKESKYYAEFQDFFTEFKLVILEEIENYLAEGDDKSLKKAQSNLSKLTKIDPDDGGAWLMRGVVEIKRKDRTGSRESLEAGMNIIENMKSFDDLSEDRKKFLKRGLMIYADYLHNSNKTEDAKSIISLGYQYFQNDEEYDTKYNEIQRG